MPSNTLRLPEHLVLGCSSTDEARGIFNACAKLLSCWPVVVGRLCQRLDHHSDSRGTWIHGAVQAIGA